MCTVFVTVTLGAAEELTCACTLNTRPDTFAVSDGIEQVTDPVEASPHVQSGDGASMETNAASGGMVSETTVFVAAVGPALAAGIVEVTSVPGPGKTGACVLVTGRSAGAPRTVTA